jgi:hypothetical protein
MILYHGSFLEIPEPDTRHSRPKVDFGPGFYTTPIKEQASKWCARFSRDGGHGVINAYECDEAFYAGAKVLRFDSYSEDWLDYVMACRRGAVPAGSYDVVEGGVADDKVFNTVELYLDGLIDKGEAIKRLRFEKPNWQVCFRTQTAIEKCLQFVGSETL